MWIIHPTTLGKCEQIYGVGSFFHQLGKEELRVLHEVVVNHFPRGLDESDLLSSQLGVPDLNICTLSERVLVRGLYESDLLSSQLGVPDLNICTLSERVLLKFAN